MKIRNFVEKFFNLIYQIAKYLSALIVAICIFALLITGVDLFFSGPSLKVPEFSEYVDSIEGKPNVESEFAKLDEKRKVEKAYGDLITKLVKNYGLSAESYDILINDMVKMDEKFRDDYINRFSKFLSKVKKYNNKKNSERIKIVDAANYYRNEFFDAIERFKVEKEENKVKRMYKVGIFLSLIITLLMFLIVPLLIKIEENTRHSTVSKENTIS